MTVARDSDPYTMAEAYAPRWSHSLHVKFAALLVLLALLISLGAAFSGRLIVLQPLVADEFRYEHESGLRLSQALEGLAREADLVAGTLARLAASQNTVAALSPAPPRLIDAKGRPTPFSGVGIWLQPDASGKPQSGYWQRDGAGVFRQREEYADPRTAPYWKERWYTPARYAQEDRCYWTPPYLEPLSKREIVSCALPIRNAQGFAGVVTLDLPLESLSRILSDTGDKQDGYSLLLDNDNRLLAVSGAARSTIGGSDMARNLAGLAQKQAAYNPLALVLHRSQESARSAVARSSVYDASEVSELERDTRALSRTEAEAALIQIWAPLTAPVPNTEALPKIENDPVLRGDARTTLFDIPTAPWQVLRVTSAESGLAVIDELFALNVLVSAGIFVLLLIAAYLVLSYWVVRPLRRMSQELAASPGMDEALLVTLDESSRDEVGALAHWYNERTRQLRELVAKAGTATAQLSKESGERRGALEMVSRLQDRSAALLQSVHDAVLITDDQGHLEDMNPAAEKLLGVSVGAARGRPLADLLELRHADVPLPDLPERAHAIGGRLEYRDAVTLLAAGSSHAVEVSATPLRNRANRATGTVVVLRARHVSTATIADQLTPAESARGLPGRMALDRRIRSLLDAARVVPRTHSLLLLDVDHLRQINESAGRAAGDEVLTRLGDLLNSESQRLGEVFRIGRDQFAIVLEGIDTDSARHFADELREAVAARPLRWSDHNFTITVSIGVTTFSASDDSPVTILDHAETACAGAKGAGRNQVQVYIAGLPAAAAHRDDSLWVRRIRAGLDHNLFHLTTQYLQPSPALLGEGACFELLLALEDEEGFWNEASAFIGAAERHHLIPEMDRWVMRQLFAQLGRDSGLCERLSFVALNLSAPTLADASLLDFLVELLQKHPEIPARKLCFEVREDAILEHPQQAQSFFEAARAIGCQFAIDHFHGRGLSDLALLRKLPVEMVKISALDFRRIGEDPLEQFLATSTINLARTLRKRVIVTGIEDLKQLEFWRGLSADYIQGTLVARPSPIPFVGPQR